jgi:deazaflavin-dependent oxidoreductase (nitroreductase family)
MTDQPRYLEPDWFTRNIFNRSVSRLTRLGFSVWGSRVLRIQGRKSGEWRSTAVNLLTVDGQRYLVSPRGNTQWARNLRVAGNGELQVGRRIEVFRATELGDEHKAPVIRAYLKRWKFEVGMFFPGLDADSSDETIATVASGFPVFTVSTVSSESGR